MNGKLPESVLQSCTHSARHEQLSTTAVQRKACTYHFTLEMPIGTVSWRLHAGFGQVTACIAAAMLLHGQNT